MTLDTLLNKSFRVLSCVKQRYRDSRYFAYKICAYSCHSRVICQALRARAITFLPVFPWRVTYLP